MTLLFGQIQASILESTAAEGGGAMYFLGMSRHLKPLPSRSSALKYSTACVDTVALYRSLRDWYSKMSRVACPGHLRDAAPVRCLEFAEMHCMGSRGRSKSRTIVAMHFGHGMSRFSDPRRGSCLGMVALSPACATTPLRSLDLTCCFARFVFVGLEQQVRADW